ncbi:MAG: hypothetical protein WAL25_10565 [Acidimicrobiia bacterium]
MSLRSLSRSSLGWLFGISLSVLFVSLWGRAVVVDTDALADSIAPLAHTETVVDFVAGWMGDEMVESGVAPALVEPAVGYFLGSSALGQTVDEFAEEVVDAAASTDPAGSSIDMRALIAPAVPEVTLGLAGLGYDVSDDRVRAVVESLDPLVIRTPGSSPLLGPASQTAARLGIASLLASVALLVFGAVFVRLSDDRIGAVRSLLNRVAVGGLSFAVLLRLGSWVIDPSGGRAPVQEALSNLAGSKWMVPLQLGLTAAAMGAAIFVWRRLRPGEATPSRDEAATPSREQTGSLTRSR